VSEVDREKRVKIGKRNGDFVVRRDSGPRLVRSKKCEIQENKSSLALGKRREGGPTTLHNRNEVAS